LLKIEIVPEKREVRARVLRTWDFWLVSMAVNAVE